MLHSLQDSCTANQRIPLVPRREFYVPDSPQTIQTDRRAADPIHVKVSTDQGREAPPVHELDELKRLRRFIESLDPDWDRAGQVYESMRRSLVSYFRARCCLNPEDLADETIDRVARKYKEARDLPKFIRGIARRVASEKFRTIKTISIDDVSEPHSKDAPDKEADPNLDRLSALERILENLSPADREMVVAYYRFEGAARIKNRQRLAEALNTSVQTLAVRVLRARRILRSKWAAYTSSGNGLLFPSHTE